MMHSHPVHSFVRVIYCESADARSITTFCTAIALKLNLTANWIRCTVRNQMYDFWQLADFLRHFPLEIVVLNLNIHISIIQYAECHW